jgi:hypothetical protein
MRKGRRRRYGRRIIGFYTDKQGRVRLITSRTGRRRIWKVFGRNLIRTRPPISTPKFPRSTSQIRIGESLIRTTMNLVLHQTPILRELQSAYLVADAVYANRDLIKKVYSSYQKGDLREVAKEVGSNVLHDVLSSTWTNIVWAVIRGPMRGSCHDPSFNVFSMVMKEITDDEIKYVRRFLEEAE